MIGYGYSMTFPKPGEYDTSNLPFLRFPKREHFMGNKGFVIAIADELFPPDSEPREIIQRGEFIQALEVIYVPNLDGFRTNGNVVSDINAEGINPHPLFEIPDRYLQSGEYLSPKELQAITPKGYTAIGWA